MTGPDQAPDLPDWLRPVEQAARDIEASDLTRFVPPPGSDARRGAVLMLFGEGPQGGELLLTIGLLLPATADGCRDYLTDLDAAGGP